MTPDEVVIANNLTKGSLGKLVETEFFGINPGNDHAPDFPDAGVELKTTGVNIRVIRQTGETVYVAKERLSLTMIDYMDVVEEIWDSCTVMEKCRLMLMVFYLFEKDTPIASRKFVMAPFLWQFPAEDLEIIKNDWCFIVNKIKSGMAHQLSEGDTMYLGACRKGNDKIPHRKQPNSDVLCLSRAFCLKQTYMTIMIKARGNRVVPESLYGATSASQPIEDVIAARLRRYEGVEVADIIEQLSFDRGQEPKHLLRLLSSRMLGVKTENIRELEKAEVTIKTIRLSASGTPKESMSFAAFKSAELVNQTWEESKFNKELEERKYLLMVFRYDAENKLRFSHGRLWNMPWEDRQEAKRVWEETKRRIIAIQADKLPLSDFSSVSHVRPKARDRDDTETTPYGQTITKKCFWLNASYISKIATAQ